MRVKYLIFNTNWIAEIKSGKIKNGEIIVEDKTFPVDKVRHFTMKTFFGSIPLYLFKWNTIFPLEFKEKISPAEKYVDENGNEIQLYRKELVPISDLEFKEKAKMMPQFLKDLNEIRFLRSMKRYVEPKPGLSELPIIPMILCLVLGIIIMYFIIASGIIKV